MKKDIQLPEVKGLQLAVVFEYNDIFQCDDWNIYLVNNSDKDFEMVIIVSKGYSETKSTSLMRKRVDKLPANSFAKIELLQEELFQVNNQFQISYFADGTVYETMFLLEKDTISQDKLKHIIEMNKQGIFAKQIDSKL